MKILVINYRFHFTGGPERYMFNVMEELEKEGHQVIPFSVSNPRNENSAYSKFFVNNIANSEEYLFENFNKNLRFYYDYLSREFYSPRVKRKLEVLLKEVKPDICYLLPHKPALSISVIDALKKYKVPIVHRISDYNIICAESGMYRNRVFCNACKENRFSSLKYRCIKGSITYSALRYISMSVHRCFKIYDKIDHFIATNNFARDQFIDFGFKEEKISTIETFSGVYRKQPKSIVNHPLRLLCVGNIDDSKGTFDLIDALHIIKKKNELKNDFILDIYGGLRDFEREKLQSRINELGLHTAVTLKSKVSQQIILKKYQEVDLLIIPARWVENLPNVLIEGLSNGTPLVTPDFGSFMAVLDDSVTFFYEAHNVESLAQTLIYTKNNKRKIISKSKNCYDFVQRKFDKDLHMQKLLTLFKRVIIENN